jgi:hypothetical protein
VAHYSGERQGIVRHLFVDAKSLTVVQTVYGAVSATGGRIVKVGVFATNWSTLYHWNNLERSGTIRNNQEQSCGRHHPDVVIDATGNIERER